jgi:hypothetical protein
MTEQDADDLKKHQDQVSAVAAPGVTISNRKE